MLGAFQQLGAFGPLGGIRADLYIMPPFGDEPPDLAEIASKIDLGTGGGMVPGSEGGGMHRTDTIDFVTVIEGDNERRLPGRGRQRTRDHHRGR